MASKTPLGKFVNSFISRGTSGFDHIKNSALIRREASNLTGDFSAEGSALAESLQKLGESENDALEFEGERELELQTNITDQHTTDKRVPIGKDLI